MINTKEPAKERGEGSSASFYSPMKRKHKLVFIVCFTVVTFTIWLSLTMTSTAPLRPANNEASLPRSTPLPLTEPLLGDNHILFIETSCADPNFRPGDRGIVLKPRQACSIESAARTNPQSLVYLLYTCPIDDDAFEDSRVFVRHVLSYPNVRLWRVDIDYYFQGTPLESFYKAGGWVESKWPKEHSSDVLRYLTLWKYGGTYLDLDMVVRRSFADLGANFAGAEAGDLLASCVLNFGADPTGREVASQCLTHLSTDFRGDIWGHNGPWLITRVLIKLCNTTETAEMTSLACSCFTVHQRSVFFPIGYDDNDLARFFDTRQSDETMARMRDSHAVHMWNKLSYDKAVNVGSRQPYGRLALEFCPEVYQSCGPIF